MHSYAVQFYQRDAPERVSADEGRCRPLKRVSMEIVDYYQYSETIVLVLWPHSTLGFRRGGFVFPTRVHTNNYSACRWRNSIYFHNV